MNKKIVEIKKLKIGSIVKINKDSKYYDETRDPAIAANPANIKGSVLSEDGDWYRVRWSNSRTNSYTVEDLDCIDGDLIITKVLENIVKFKKDPESIDNILDTLYNKNGTVETYHCAEDGSLSIIQCNKFRMRSFDDIYYIFKSYFPETTVKEVLERMLTYNVTEKDLNNNLLPYRLATCSTMMRIRYSREYMSVTYNYGAILKNKYNSLYSWSELFEMLDIKSAEDLLSWVKNNYKKYQRNEVVH